MKLNHLIPFKRYYILIGILGLVFWSLSIYKASHSAFTHDESFTYITYVKKSVIGIVSMQPPVSANNHILNSLSMKVIDKLMSPNPFNLRIPNILGHLLFIVFSALIINDFRNNYFKVAGFILLNSNIYLIDLFSLARGYGLSLGLLMIHWYYLIKLITEPRHKTNFKFMLIALFLAIASNFSIIYYALSLSIIYVFYEVKKRTEVKKPYFLMVNLNSKFLIVTMILFIAFLYEPIRKLVKFNQLYFGGTNNFFDDTIYSLVFYSSTSAIQNEFIIKIIYVLVVIAIGLIFLRLLFKLFKNQIEAKSNLFAGSFILVMIIQIILFYLFNTKYLIQRTAVFLIPLFTIAILSIINEAGYSLGYFLITFVALFLFYITVQYTPLNKSLNWTYDADNENVINDLENIYANAYSRKKLNLGIDWIFHPSLNYYRLTSNAGNWLDTLDREGYENKKFNYYFVESQSLNKFADTTKFKLLKTYSTSGNSLIKNLKFE